MRMVSRRRPRQRFGGDLPTVGRRRALGDGLGHSGECNVADRMLKIDVRHAAVRVVRYLLPDDIGHAVEDPLYEIGKDRPLELVEAVGNFRQVHDRHGA